MCDHIYKILAQFLTKIIIIFDKNFARLQEPFAFSEDELPRELMVIDATHIYISELQKYDFSRFQELITRGSIYH